MAADSLADRLREERKRLGMSQKEIAQKVSVNRETWSRYETSKMLPSTNVLLKAVDFGLDAHYVLTGQKADPLYSMADFKSSALVASEEINGYNNPSSMSLTERERTLVNHYRGVNQEGKRTIDEIAKLLAMQQLK